MNIREINKGTKKVLGAYENFRIFLQTTIKYKWVVFDKDISFPVVLLLCPTQSASIDRGIGGELSCLCHSSSASVQYSARSIEYYSPKVLYNVSIVQPAVFIPILSNIQPLTILSTIQQLFPTKNSFILHSSQANKTPKKQFARRIFKIPFKKKWWDFWLLIRWNSSQFNKTHSQYKTRFR